MNTAAEFLTICCGVFLPVCGSVEMGQGGGIPGPKEHDYPIRSPDYSTGRACFLGKIILK